VRPRPLSYPVSFAAICGMRKALRNICYCEEEEREEEEKEEEKEEEEEFIVTSLS